MPPTSALNNLGQMFEKRFKYAYTLFRNEQYEAANSEARDLLSEPRLSDFHRAGLHLLLAHSPDDFVSHANKAVELYENLYGPDDAPTSRQRKSRDTLVAAAKKVQQRALADEAKIEKHTYRTMDKEQYIQEQNDVLAGGEDEVKDALSGG